VGSTQRNTQQNVLLLFYFVVVFTVFTFIRNEYKLVAVKMAFCYRLYKYNVIWHSYMYKCFKKQILSSLHVGSLYAGGSRFEHRPECRLFWDSMIFLSH